MIIKRNNKMNNSWKQYYNQYLSHIVKVDDENDRNNINQWLVMLLNVIKNDQNVINEIYQIENNIVSKLILITTSCLDQDILPVTIVTNVYNIYKIMLRKHESNNSNNALYTEQFVKLAITILNQLFSIGINNRMAYNLKEKIEAGVPSIISSGVIPGTVQLTPSGQIIILHRDCQTTGGYPRIFQLDEKSLNNLAQLRIGDKIKFELANL